MSHWASIVWGLWIGLLIPLGATAQPAVEAEPLFPGVALERPIAVLPWPDQYDHWLVAEQPGRLILIDASEPDGEPASTVGLDLTAHLPHYADRGRDQLGLLGVALHPNFAENRQFFLHYTASRPRRNVVSRYTLRVDGVIDPDSEEVLLEQRQPYATNNGGALAFGPDGYLYIGLGDGGANGDPRNRAQRLDTYLGKVLRIDVDLPGQIPGVGVGRREQEAGNAYTIPGDNPFVDLPGALPEVYAYGLSNPWRFSFDRLTGDLWLGDVGENDWEEINRIDKGGNYGWRWREGAHEFSLPTAQSQLPNDLIDPVHEYPHAEGKAVVGGYVYRGSAIPELIGHYVYADYASGKVWALQFDDDGKVIANHHLFAVPHPSSFGEDANGELYLCSFGKHHQNPDDDRIYKLVRAAEN